MKKILFKKIRPFRDANWEKKILKAPPIPEERFEILKESKILMKEMSDIYIPKVKELKVETLDVK